MEFEHEINRDINTTEGSPGRYKIIIVKYNWHNGIWTIEHLLFNTEQKRRIIPYKEYIVNLPFKKQFQTVLFVQYNMKCFEHSFHYQRLRGF